MDPSPLPTDADWRASIGTRFWARLLDGLVVGLPLLLLTLAVVDVDADQPTLPLWATLLSLAVAAAYEILLIALRGQTVGKRLLKIQVVDVQTGLPPTLGGATIRWALPGVPAALPGIGPVLGLLVYLSAVWSPTRQGWHDKAAGTVVVRTAARQAIQGGWTDAPPAPGASATPPERPPHPSSDDPFGPS